MPENASKPVRFEDRVAWFQQARFGLFMHWGLYSMPAKYEWIRSTAKKIGRASCRERVYVLV